jgi:cytochrome c oxidase subunit 2
VSVLSPTSAPQGHTEFIANGCGACHSVRGTAADGRIGPDLTHVGSRFDIGGGALRRDSETLAKWIEETDTIKPGVHMPAFRALPPDRIRAMAAYLMSLQ